MKVVLLTLMMAGAPAGDDDVAAILDEIDDLYRGRSSRATMTMRVKTEHYERTMRMKAWSLGKQRSLVRIERPLKEKGTATLKSDDDIYTYLPKTDRTIRLTSGMMMGAWMGSHFTNDDLVKESRLLDDYTPKRKGDRIVDGRAVVDIVLVPKDDAAVVWGKIEIAFDATRRVPMQSVYFDEDGRVARTMTFSRVEKVAGRLRPRVMRVVPADKPEELTEVTYEAIEFDVGLTDAFFSLGKLRRR